MDGNQRETWHRLERHPFDHPGAALTFSRRLPRENGWTQRFARRAIEEYRRFCFLARHAGHPVTPSDEVDQVWHLHLTYTRDYWDVFCADVLRAPLHHGPTQGGEAEDSKFEDWYERTRESYREFFGEPPADFWPPSRQRFADAGAFRRVNTARLLLLDRETLRRWTLGGLGGAATLAASTVAAQEGGGTSALAIAALALGLLVFVGIMSLAVNRAKKAGEAARDSSGGAYVGSDGGGSSGKAVKSADSDGSADGGSSGCSSGCGGGCGG
ncbi:MAG: hypothetical protein AAGE01_13625 [Pseudomonadota bacterium]